MKKLWTVLAAAVLLAAAFAGCKAEDDITSPTPKPETKPVVVNVPTEEREHYIEVIGNGEVIASPDIATITLSVTTSGETAEAASLSCQEQTTNILAAAGELHILAPDISQRGIELVPVQKEGSTQVSSYQASDMLTIIVRRMAQVETIMTTLSDVSLYEFSSITYSITEASEAYRQALVVATEDALAKATVLAESTGVALGAVVGIVETEYDDSKLIGVAYESTAIAVAAEVTVRYRIGK